MKYKILRTYMKYLAATKVRKQKQNKLQSMQQQYTFAACVDSKIKFTKKLK